MSDDTKEASRLRIGTESRLRAAIGRMPYGGNLSEPPVGQVGPLTLDDVATYLEALADRLEGVAKRDHEQEQQLHELKDDVAAFRRVVNG